MLPFLLNPGVLFILFSFIAVLVPMIEETFKPIGVWFLAGQKITPAQGFGYGVISGAGFALFENLGNTSSGGEAWALVAGSRISTLLLHCFTAGLVGWGLASAWSQRRYLRLALTYAIAVLVHGFWNGLAVLSAASSLQGMTNIPLPASLQKVGAFASVGILILGVVVFIFFVSFNSLLRRNMAAMPPPSNGDSQPLYPPGEASQLSSVIELSLPTADINNSFPIPPNNNPTIPESNSQLQLAGENPSTTPETNT
jgi:RsiW-degrading membrane proteinase PrsW (M82 family)